MRYINGILVFFTLVVNVQAQGQNLQKKMDSLRKKETLYEYWDEAGQNVYAFGWIEQRYGLPVFRKVIFDEITQVMTIEGITTMTGLPADTSDRGTCPFEIIAATPGPDYHLRNVRKLGVTQCQDSAANSKDGFFSVQFKVNPGDILIIGNPGRAGSGAIVYNISMLLKRD